MLLFPPLLIINKTKYAPYFFLGLGWYGLGNKRSHQLQNHLQIAWKEIQFEWYRILEF